MELDHIIPPPTAFYFNVHFIGSIPIMDMAFLEVSGMSMEMEIKEIDEGGGHKRHIPGPMKHGNLVCKRPMKPLAMSALSVWTSNIMMGGMETDIVTCDVMVTLLSPIGTPECGWCLTGVYPVKWDIAGFDSKKNDVALETLEFAYDTITRVI